MILTIKETVPGCFDIITERSSISCDSFDQLVHKLKSLFNTNIHEVLNKENIDEVISKLTDIRDDMNDLLDACKTL